MRNVSTIQDIYPAVEELILLLKEREHTKISSVLEHRMHEVSWTSASELYEELRNILCNAISNSDVAHEIKEQMRTLVTVIDKGGGV